MPVNSRNTPIHSNVAVGKDTNNCSCVQDATRPKCLQW